MTPVGPGISHAAPRPPPRRHRPAKAPRPAARRQGGVARAPAPIAGRVAACVRPTGAVARGAPPLRPARPAAPPPRSRPARAARRLRDDRRPPRRRAGAQRRPVHELRRVPALPGHHPARRPGFDLRSQRLRPRGQPPAADRVGEPEAHRAPARGGHRAGRAAGPRRGRDQPARRTGCRATPSSSTWRGASRTTSPPPSRSSPFPASPSWRSRSASRRRATWPDPCSGRSGWTTTACPAWRGSTTTRSPVTRRADHREGPRGPHHPGRRAPARARAARRRPRAHHRPIDAVRDRAGARRPDPRQGRQRRHRDRVSSRDRRDPRAGQLHHRSGDRRDRRHRQQHGRDGGLRARLREQGDHGGRRARGGAGHPRHRAHGARLAAGERPPLHRPRPAPHRELLGDPHPHRVVEHRHHQARPDASARTGSTRTCAASASAPRPRSTSRTRRPGSSCDPPTTPAPRSARSRSARASRSPRCRCSRRTTCSPTTACTCRRSW